MKSLFFFAALLSIAMADKWALVVSGNNGYYNYCITSTICRGYDILHDAGVAEDHMVYLGFNDVFDSPSNPFPGSIFTDQDPEGPGIDYAPGCRPHIDYPDKMVSAELFMATLSGDKEEVTKLTGVENPKVIESGPEDTIFVYYMDHGAIGFCEVGKSELYEEVLISTINKMYENKQYMQLVFYFEACHSGSMFRTLEKGKNVYAMTGSDTEHSAWMNNCPPNDVVNGKSMGTCLGAWFDNFWMQEVTDNGADLTHNEMFKIVHDKTAEETDQNVSQFGDMAFRDYKVADFFGKLPSPSFRSVKKSVESTVAVSEVPAHLAKWKAIRASAAEKKSALEAYEKILVAEAKKEVEVMRLGRMLMNEKAADNALKTPAESYSASCVRDLSIELVKKCGHTMPFPQSVNNMLRNICLPGLSVPNVNWNDICM